MADHDSCTQLDERVSIFRKDNTVSLVFSDIQSLEKEIEISSLLAAHGSETLPLERQNENASEERIGVSCTELTRFLEHLWDEKLIEALTDSISRLINSWRTNDSLKNSLMTGISNISSFPSFIQRCNDQLEVAFGICDVDDICVAGSDVRSILGNKDFQAAVQGFVSSLRTADTVFCHGNLDLKHILVMESDVITVAGFSHALKGPKFFDLAFLMVHVLTIAVERKDVDKKRKIMAELWNKISPREFDEKPALNQLLGLVGLFIVLGFSTNKMNSDELKIHHQLLRLSREIFLRRQSFRTFSDFLAGAFAFLEGQNNTTATLFLVSKFPTRGKSKTRLIPSIGEQNAYDICCAFLRDILRRFSNFELADRDISLRKILLFAPQEKETEMKTFVSDAVGGPSTWEVQPMLQSNLSSSDLGDKLANALQSAKTQTWGPVIFIGMDTPQLSEEEIQRGVDASLSGKAFLNPAEDGGYTLLSVPCNAPTTVFHNIEWSTCNTLQSQTQAIESLAIQVDHGDRYFDIDTVQDLEKLLELCRRDDGVAQMIPASFRAMSQTFKVTQN